LTLQSRIAQFLFPNTIAQVAAEAAKAAAAAISIRVDDSAGWDQLTPGPADRPWSQRSEDLEDALEAWRKNFLIRRIVTLVRSYVVGNGISVSSQDSTVDQFVQAFWTHKQNRIDRRLGPMCDELTRAGEIFPILFTNRLDGISYIRFVPASRIQELETDPEDYEIEWRYGERKDTVEPKWWRGPGHPAAYRPGASRSFEPLMLHFSVNKPIGATRGEGDLTPILPWALRYSEWLKDRVRLNRIRTRTGVLDVEIADDSLVEQKRQQLRRTNPLEAGIYVHSQGETVTLHDLNVRANDAAEDGKLLRLATSTGANVALHYLGEGESTNYATAKEMGEPSARFFSERQLQLCGFLTDLVEAAYRRAEALGKVPPVEDLQLITNTPEVARADNLALAQAAKEITFALGMMYNQGWIDRYTAAGLAFKFAGEALSEDEIQTILDKAEQEAGDREQEEEQEAGGREQEMEREQETAEEENA
jgi:hypothetical protein